MKKIALLTLAGVLVVALSALTWTAVAQSGKSSGKGTGPKKEKQVTYVFQGTVTEVNTVTTTNSDGTTTSEDSVKVDVKRGNNAARSYIGQEVPFVIDSSTKVERNDEDASFSDIQLGDKANVQVKAPASATSFTARQLKAEGPEQTTDSDTDEQ